MTGIARRVLILVGALGLFLVLLFVGLVLSGPAIGIAPGWTGLYGRYPAGEAVLVTDRSSHVIKRVAIEPDRSFRQELPPGDYDVVAEGRPCGVPGTEVIVLPGFHTLTAPFFGNCGGLSR